ncbi:MAG: class I SAM-dependent methyltransferase [Solirubrobacteraceae bacterium]
MLPVSRRKGWLKLPAEGQGDGAVKPAGYLPHYEELLGDLRKRRFTLLELGVWEGRSLEMWRDAFPRATIVGVDISPPRVAIGPNVHVIGGDQSDSALLDELRERFAPQGFQVVVDDASHFGIKTAESLQALFPHQLAPGGLYFIEDWGTGYWPAWEDGGSVVTRLDEDCLASTSARSEARQGMSMPSHDVGVVGLIKRLIDHTARDTVRMGEGNAVGTPLEIESMTIWNGLVALRKLRR